MKKITLWLFALFTCWQISAQTTVTIGTGTTTAASANGSPVYRSSAASTFNFSQSIELLTAADLSAVGIFPGSTITKIAYKKTDVFTLSAGRTASMKLYLKNSATTTFAGTTNFTTYTTGSTLCYNNAAYSSTDLPAAAGWVEFVFSTPFSYTGGSIEVGIDWAINAGTGSATTGAFSWEYTTVTANQAVGNSDSVALTGNLTTTATRIYNTQLTYTAPPCSGTPAPGNTIAPTNICYGTSATLSLQNPTLGTYQWFMNGTAIAGATGFNYIISSVTTTATYNCEVTCSGVTTASNAVTVSPSILNAPVTEPFTTFLPTCWTNMFGGDLATGPTVTTGSGWVVDGFANVGTTGAIRNEIFTTGANDWVISPVINIPATGYELKFDAAATQFAATGIPTTPWEADDTIEVLVATGGSTTNWTVLYTYNAGNQPLNTGTSNILSLNAYANQNIRIAFRAVEGTANGTADIDFSIDNFLVRLTPLCPDQTGLVVGGVTASGANTSWDALTGNTGYEYAVTTSATPPASGTATTNTFAIITGLNPQTLYYLHVRSACTAGAFGVWSTISFTTACSIFTTLPHAESFDNVALPNCWTTALVTGTTNWATTASNDGVPSPRTGARFAGKSWVGNDDALLISPGYNLAAYPTNQTRLNVWIYRSANGIATDRTTFYVNTTNNLTGATMLVDIPLLFTATPAVASAGWYNYIADVPLSFNTAGNFYIIAEGRTSSSLSSYGIGFDDYKFELSPTCPDVTGLVIGGISSTGANTSWDALTGVTGYEYAVTTSATPPASGTATTNTFAVISGLAPQTTYYLHVRAACTGSTFGTWSTSPAFTTLCGNVTSFVQNFDSVTASTLPAGMPTCWTKVGTLGSCYTSTTTPVGSAPNVIYFFGSATAAPTMRMQPVSNLGAGTHRLKFKMRSSSATILPNVSFGYLTNQDDASTFVELTTFVPTGVTMSNFVYSPPAGTYSNYPAVKMNGTVYGTVYMDDFVWEPNPACPDQTGVVVAGVTTTGASSSWDAIAGVSGYEYAVTTSATPPTSGTAISTTFTSISGLTANTLYYLYVRPVCSVGVFGAWASTNFFTGYCVPSSTAATSYINDFTTTGGSQNISNLATGFTAGGYLNASTQFVQGFATSSFSFNAVIAGPTVGFAIWVDWNNDLVFDNATEKVFNTTAYGSGPFTGSITIPAGTAIGNYRMRIVTDFNALNPTETCALRPRAEYEDYTVSVVAPPACVPPVLAASGLTNATATLTWPAVTTAASGYEYVLNNVATDPTGAGTATTALTYSATGLTQLTQYYFHLRSVCSTGTYSTWSTISFTTLATPPANDNCANAVALTVNANYLCGAFVSGTTVGATDSGVEPTLAVSGTPDNDVWYSFTATQTAHRISLTNVVAVTGTGVDMGIGLYNGPCGSLTLVGSSDPNTYDVTGLTIGNTYLVNVYGWYVSGTANEANATFNICVGADPALGNQSFNNNNFTIYPNPVKDILNINYTENITKIQVINMLGQEILTKSVNNTQNQVDMSGLVQGSYLVKVTSNDVVKTIKVIKE